MGRIYIALVTFIKLMIASALVSGLIGVSINTSAYVASVSALGLAMLAGVVIYLLSLLERKENSPKYNQIVKNDNVVLMGNQKKKP